MGGYVGIPTSYTPVEYIENSGTQYIDTNWSMDSNSKIEIKIDFANNNKQECIFCGRDFNSGGTGINNFTVFKFTNSLYRMDYNSIGTNFSHSVSASTPYIYVMNKNNLYENNVLIRTEATATFTTTNTLFLMAARNHDNSINNWMQGKLYYCKIWDGDTLVRDFIPVVNQDNVACLYDLVEGNFYYNKGTGTFTTGSTTGEPVSTGGRARKIAKAYVGVPASYTPVDYIESSGTQYIDTGFLPNSNTSVILEAKIPSSRSSNITRFFESRNEASSVVGSFGIISFNDNNNLLQIRYDASTSLSNAQLSIDVKHKISMLKNELYVDDVLKITAPTSTFQTNYSLLIFGFHTPSAKQNGEGVYLLYSFKIYDNGTLVRDYIPVIDQDNVACLYEQIEGKLYYNEGSGTFTAGSATGQAVSLGSVAREIQKGYVGIPASYTPVDYIESSGTQYIDTGLKTNEVSKIQAIASNTFGLTYENIPYGNSLFGARVSSTDSNFQYANGAYNEFVGNGAAQLSLTRNTSTNVLTIEISKTSYSVASQDYNISGSLNISISTPLNIYLFGLNNNGTFSGGTWEIYTFKMYDNSNNLIRDFIPVIDQDNVVCLYEQVEGRLYYNKGTGTFTAGSTTGQEVVLSPVARLCYSASALPDTALFLCHLDNSTINEITGNNTVPYSSSVVSYSAGKWGKQLQIKNTEISGSYSETAYLYSLRDGLLPGLYNIFQGTANPITLTCWRAGNAQNDGWSIAYGYGWYSRAEGYYARAYRCAAGVDISNNYLRIKIMYRNNSIQTASYLTDVPSTVYNDGQFHHYALEISPLGVSFYFDGVYKGTLAKPRNIYFRWYEQYNTIFKGR